jgi:hypothetical protein
MHSWIINEVSGSKLFCLALTNTPSGDWKIILDSPEHAFYNCFFQRFTCGYQCISHNQTPMKSAVARRKKAKSLEEYLVKEQQNPPPGMRFELEYDESNFINEDGERRSFAPHLRL